MMGVIKYGCGMGQREVFVLFTVTELGDNRNPEVAKTGR